MSYFECFSVTVLTIHCSNPKFRPFFCAKLGIAVHKKNANRSEQLSRSSYTFLCLSFRHLFKNKQIVKNYEQQLTKRSLEGRFEGFKVSSWFLKIMKLPPGGGVLSYKGLMGTCGQPWLGYVFRDCCLKRESISYFFFLIRVSILSIFVLNRVSFLGR